MHTAVNTLSQTNFYQFRYEAYPPLAGVIMYTMFLFGNDTPADSKTHVWLMTIGNVSYFIPRR
ncbi:hypothetical protein VM99_06560 [Pseudomonas chlororaphis]|uniref:Uncharacterized protein n=1 Tax=Pseudomonas chlororaphis TaxID=587753 RepID=A0A0G3GDX3_9PSED|nr:hypothetical protein VM99_06560 [Pseudomonas chlororaphis]